MCAKVQNVKVRAEWRVQIFLSPTKPPHHTAATSTTSTTTSTTIQHHHCLNCAVSNNLVQTFFLGLFFFFFSFFLPFDPPFPLTLPTTFLLSFPTCYHGCYRSFRGRFYLICCWGSKRTRAGQRFGCVCGQHLDSPSTTGGRLWRKWDK
jgi:hypothetical protein